MPKKVKNSQPRTRKPSTTVSSKHQVTIPAIPFRAAGLRSGDRLRAEARGTGEIVLTRVDELVERYSGAVDTDGRWRRALADLRDEWP